MRSTFSKAVSRTAVCVFAGLLSTAAASDARAADVYLRAEAFDKSMPDGELVPMWGFASCDVGWTTCDPPTAPGPRLEVSSADPLTVHVDNTLPVPVSIGVPGQSDGGDPVWTTDGRGRRRVRSFTHEAAPGATADYTWTALRPGTFLYETTTQPSVQVPMGLYGALVVHPPDNPACASGTEAYDTADSCYDAEVVLVFSEVDPWLNEAIAAADGDPTAFPSTVDYEPAYFLVNGEESAPAPAGDPGDSVLVRMINAGLRSHTPAIVGLDLALLAEDGSPYPGLPRVQSGALLPASKTLDALVAMPAVDATYALYDRMPTTSATDAPTVVQLEVGAGAAPPVDPGVYAVDDLFILSEDASLLAPSVLANDVGLAGAVVSVVSTTQHGALTLAADGTFTYSPDENFAGTDGFTYSAFDGTDAYPAQVVLEVAFSNDAPIAADDGPYVNAIGPDVALAAPGVLGNDSDPDGDTLTAVLDSPPAVGALTLLPDGSFTYTGGAPNSTVTFTYHAEDGLSSSAPATVTVHVNPVANIALTVTDPLGVEVTDYRWVVQEDATYAIDPNDQLAPTDTLSTNFHKSYMPVVAQGSGAAMFAQLALDPDKRYYASILPDDAGTGEGHAIGGAQIPPGAQTLSITSNNQPIPTAQVSVIVFEDNQPTNGVPDPVEPGLGGFQIVLEEAGGRYGISGGTVSQDAFGNPVTNALPCDVGAAPPPGVIVTCPDGTALIKNLPPGKYGVIAVAPAGDRNWTQTSTIEGTKVQDAWVQADEPPFLVEFGAPGFHAFIGFVNPTHTVVPDDVPVAERDNTIMGDVTMVHADRPPSFLAFDSGSYDALSHTRAWVGLNSNAGDGANFATVRADAAGHFTITGIPDGTYQLVIWDEYLDQIINYSTVTLAGGVTDVGHVPVNPWFSRHEHNVFLDENGDGVRQPGERGLPDQNVNIRFRDGSVHQSFPTDTEGFVPFDEVFPFGAWQVAEVDYTRFRPTGLTVTVDGGGDVSGGPYPGLLNPQVGTPRTDTEPAPFLLEGFQALPGQTSIFEWGKAPYQPGENGGIAGIVFYASTRGEDDPRLTVGDPWEAGLPGVEVRLYREIATDFGGGTALALVDTVTTDSWDASAPTGCAGEPVADNPFVDGTLAGDASRCFDGIRNWNQARPAVFDGGYAFGDLAPGVYVVEVVPPPGFELVKEEDKNVDFGDAFAAAPAALMLPGGAFVNFLPDQAMIRAAMAPEPGLAQPPCVGDLHLVPNELALFPGVETYAPFAGTERPLCDRKRVVLEDQSQAAADFHLFTSTPVAAQFYGLITDDISTETNPAAPSFGDKWGPAFMPFSIRDFQGHEVYRGYSDAFGLYNGVVPSTFDANIPVPSGYSPAMYSACLNDPGASADPLVNPNYGTVCYTAQFMPRTTTYLDTPVLPQTAFAAGFDPVDCAPIEGTPGIRRVDGTGVGPLVATGGTLTLQSMGLTAVANPAYEGPLAAPPGNEPVVWRDFGFGVVPGRVSVNGTELTVLSWSDDVITAAVPLVNAGTGELVVTRGDTRERSREAVTVTIGTETPTRVHPGPHAIQDAIDAATPGDLILLDPGTYDELVILWKPVRLQGAGAGSTTINAVKSPGAKFVRWQEEVQSLVDLGIVDLLPGQPTAFDLVGPGLFGTELGAGVTVLANADGSFGDAEARIDGLTITGADSGGGIFVNAYAHGLEIANNRITGNSGTVTGGVRIGNPSLPTTGEGPFGFNVDVSIHHNAVVTNGGIGDQGVGGGISLNTGSDGYRVSQNLVCGNFSQGDGGGIAHFGLSDRGVIESNEILFNQSFNQGLTHSGGGLYVAGEPGAGGALTLGTGDVLIDANLIQGNQAGSGHGGGIRLESVNGHDVELSSRQQDWWAVAIVNNLVVNNVAGWSGGGIALQDALNTTVVFNTVADNDSTATVGPLIDPATNTSTAQPAGISSERNSAGLEAVTPVGAPSTSFSNPALTHNIVWHNRSFTYEATATEAHLAPILAPAAVGDCASGATYWDLGVLDVGFALNPQYSILTTPTGTTNFSADPQFLSAYCNTSRTLSVVGPMGVAPAAAEGGNFVDVRYGPLTQAWPAGNAPWDYHVARTSPAVDHIPAGNAARQAYLLLIAQGTAPFTRVDHDFDNQPRTDPKDLGADEVRP